MHFYRTMNTIKALTFDLDDTLYDNSMIVEKAEEEMLKTLQSYEQLHTLTISEYLSEKHTVLVSEPEIYHDVNVWRSQTIKSLLNKTDIPVQKFADVIDESMTCFNFWRHKMQVLESTHMLLTKLATKYPLAVITNGNVDVHQIGLGDYFQFSLRGGEDGRSKPFPEIFELASDKLSISPHHILHVGDNLLTDVNGAINNGFLACFINIYKHDIFQLDDTRCLPHIEITQLLELDNLL
ncbi:5-amino-6-(5-phospho-D-ribitylamino)uracil phosphatase YigB [Gilliamella sp. Pra-s65]|uniref:5-amino-6-(5-phospho-D-ribitylamino)uracil phosphatase YigB n=1 Tax=unclassified Gilliamella TaxID=2685620 RepID=UPI001365DCB8|nr:MULTISPECIES: 5-amino-6-(5-phospho-D-ribitylamino)uracil phosphatase YigB [unclassified Gilliamella]MWN90015.1 5-amino-6-(5-phospho-D-ribitylamino)uracil phosphatase YigB [Gilliamella sp. Pra-s65]MWP72859.1 5-amino-6-(5-phospho-D-ribitylamino)uracil phosphatase YigB [Gilliamella sp. Pra-s52]